MFGEIVRAMIAQVLVVGMVLGIVLCLTIALVAYLCHHITIGWVP